VFTPTTAGARTATISIASNDANSPYTFTLNGEGVFAANNLAAPTLFTPNGDGNNDTFIISAPTLARGNLKIFNRKGGLVFSSNDVSEITQVGWDGTYKGTALPTGTYIWQITGTFTDGTPVKRQTGEIYLVR
jgi:gliding motility-associated-like protein